jgi:predicted CoA-binding protein
MLSPSIGRFFMAQEQRMRCNVSREWRPDMTYSDALLRKVLTQSKVIACVGFSPKERRPSHRVSRYLQEQGFRVVPVNPRHAGEVVLGEEIVASLGDIAPEIDVDMVDIFRRSEEVLPVVEDALARFPNLAFIWMQIGVENSEAAELAQARGVTVIQNRCPKIEYARLFGAGAAPSPAV